MFICEVRLGFYYNWFKFCSVSVLIVVCVIDSNVFYFNWLCCNNWLFVCVFYSMLFDKDVGYKKYMEECYEMYFRLLVISWGLVIRFWIDVVGGVIVIVVIVSCT